MPKGNGVTLVAVAAINRTGTRTLEDGRYKDIQIVEMGNQKYVRVPIIKQAKIRYGGRYGERILTFGQDEFDQIIANWEKNVTDSPPYLRPSHETGDTRETAICWFDKQSGGFLRQEGKWLFGYGVPTTDNAQQLVETGGFRFASADIDLDYVSSEVAALEARPSTSEIITFEAANFTESQEDDMPKGTDGTVQLTAEEHQVLLDAQAKLDEANQKIAQLEAQIPTPEPDVPEFVRVKLEAQEAKMAQLEQKYAERERALRLEAMTARVEGIVTKLHAVGSDGQGHPAVFTNWVKAVLLHQPIVEDDKEIVTLERGEGDEITLEAFERYIFDMVTHLVDIMPKIVQMKGQTIPADTQLERQNETFAPVGIPMAQMNDIWDKQLKELGFGSTSENGKENK